MVITDRVQTDSAPRVTPLVNKRSSNTRLSTYDPNCDSNGSRISDHINEQSISNISVNQNQSLDYLSSNNLTIKKDRICLESNIDSRNGGNVRMCNTQSNELIKPDSLNRQFSPWNAPVRNRVVARVVPYPHTSSNGPNISHSNSSLTSKSSRDIQNTIHSVRGSNSIIAQNISRNVHKSYTEKEIPSNKQDSTLSINHNILHLSNDRDSYNDLKRRPNYNQQVTYRVKNNENATKPFEIRNSSFSGSHSVKSRNYTYSDLPESSDKLVTAAEVFGEDFSDLSDNESTPPYTSPVSDNRKRKSSQIMKCKSPSSDSSSTMSVLSAEKQNRYIRVSKPHFHKKKTSLHTTSINRSKKPIKLKPSSSSDEQRHGMYSSKISRHQIKFSIQEKPEKKNISMKPLTVNVSLSNFEDNVLESDETSTRSTENSSDRSVKGDSIQKNSLNLKKKLNPLQVNKRKLMLEKSRKYKNEEHHLSSSSENNDYNNRRYQINSNNSKSYMVSENENRKMSKYILDRTYKENTYTSKMANCNFHKSKQNDDYCRRKMSYNNLSHNFVVERQFRGDEGMPIYRDKNLYLQKDRQISDSPLIKRQKIKHETSDNNIIHRSSEKVVPVSSELVKRHNYGKQQKLHQELSSDAAFQKEFDEFKKDQAGDISQISDIRKCNSSIMSSASSTGTKSLSSFKKYKAKKQDSKYVQMYDAIDSKNIFQIDVNNINIYESMYDKVKRRTHKQIENKISQHPNDNTEQRSKKKSKTVIKESKHIVHESKNFYKRQRKSTERKSTSSSRSRTSSPLVDDSISNYSSSKYSGLKRKISNRKDLQHNRSFYKSFKNKSPISYSLQNWKKKEQEEKLFYRDKYKAESKSHRPKYLENDFNNDNDEHENNSEFSYITNVSNVMNISSKSNNHPYIKKGREEIGNGSDATASTEPMEYTEVDFESMKLSDDDWKSGLSSQSSNESGAIISTNNDAMTKIKMSLENKMSKIVFGEKHYSPSREQHSTFCLESDIQAEIDIKREDSRINIIEDIKYSVKNEIKESEVGPLGIETEGYAKEEQDIAIASIMLKEESDCKSPIDWQSRSTIEMTLTSETVTSLYVGEKNCEKNSVKDNFIKINQAEIHIIEPLVECEELEKVHFEMVSPIEVKPYAICEANCTDIGKEVIKPVPESLVRSPILKASKCDDCTSLNTKVKESFIKNQLLAENISEQPVSAIDSLPDNSSMCNSVISVVSKIQITTKSSTNAGPTDKENLTSYVKSVIERVMHEQSVENQNKLKFDKALNKRNKKMSGSVTGGTKTATTTIVNTSTGSTPISLSISLQKSPPIRHQAVVIENNEPQSATLPKSISSGAQSIPGVNVCSPVASSASTSVKPSSDFVISTISTDSSNTKHILTGSNVISIINLSSGTPSLKVDPITLTTTVSSSSELKVNTDWTSASSMISDVTDTNSTHTPCSFLKSPPSEDQTKQRICTRLRRADPTKSDGNYKVVMTISTNKPDVTSRLVSKEIVPQEHNVKVLEEDVTPISEVKPSIVVKISDPYEPNFDESPLELSHYRTKKKITFFPNEEKPLEEYSTTSVTSTSTTFISKPITIITAPTTSIAVSAPLSSVVDSVSQVIDDVAHGNFNYNEYLTSFKNSKLLSLHISPSTTPLTFVSNDSRDCSSVSVDNQITGIQDVGPVSNKKNNLKHYNDEGKKLDNIHKHIVTTLAGTITGVNVLENHVLTEKSILINAELAAAHRTKTPTSNVSISPNFSTINHQQDIFALINSAVLCKPVDHMSRKTKQIHNGESSQNQLLPSIQIQPYNILENCSPIENEVSLNNFKLNVESNLQQKVSKGNLLNISINSDQPSVNSILSSNIQSSDEKIALNQFYVNVLKQRCALGAFDSSTFSQLQNFLNQTHLKPQNSSVENNQYRSAKNINSFESSSLSSSHSGLIQESSNVAISSVAQNISSKFIAELIIPREYPLVWEGKLSLKNEEAKVALHFVHGNSDLLNACMHLLIFSGSLQWNNTGSLKIVQRMRLDTSQLEGVQRRMQNTNEYCIGLALPGGDDTAQWMRQSQILKEGFIKYMREKGAAGIINVSHPDNNQQGLYVVHIFPPCDFSNSQLCAAAPRLAEITESNKVPNLLVIITTV